MREILFRGKRADNGEWIEGYLNQHRGRVIFDCCCNAINSYDYYINDYAEKFDTDLYGCVYKVIPETVGQYTGLTDRNGTMIFEGDILASTIEIIDCNDEGYSISYGREDIGVVEYRRDAFLITHKPGNWARSFFGCDNYVLGNVFDNPELLEGGEGNG